MRKEISFIDGHLLVQQYFEKEWKTLFKKIKFRGDYYFSSAKSLGV